MRTSLRIFKQNAHSPAFAGKDAAFIISIFKMKGISDMAVLQKKMYCCVKLDKRKIHTYGQLAQRIKHNTRNKEVTNSNGALNHNLIPYKTPKEAWAQVQSYLPRKNAILAREIVLIASPEWFASVSPEQVAEWEQANLRWLIKKYGRDNIIGVVTHMDETTPHIQAIIVPDVDGKLNDRKLHNGRKMLAKMQDDYAKAMRRFGLVRGEPRLTPTAKDIQQYYQTVNEGKEIAEHQKLVQAEQLPAPSLADRMDPRKYAAVLINKVLTQVQKQNAFLRAGLKQAEKDKEHILKIAENDRRRWQAIKDNPAKLKELEEALAKEVALRSQDKAEYQRLASAVINYFNRNIEKDSILRTPEALGTLGQIKDIANDLRIDLTPDLPHRQGIIRTR